MKYNKNIPIIFFKHFQEFIEDQFDFHSYCLRKMVLCAYVEMLNLEDHIKSHRFFRQAAQIAVEVMNTQEKEWFLKHYFC